MLTKTDDRYHCFRINLKHDSEDRFFIKYIFNKTSVPYLPIKSFEVTLSKIIF